MNGAAPETAAERAMIAQHGLALCTALFLVHYTLLSWWYIEDAAISFAFARNAADGLGFVAYPGGERVEGFSNPTWTLALTAFEAVGIHSFVAAKLLGAALGAATLYAAHAWARRLIADSPRLPLVAPAFLAFSPQFVIWCASGLENSLFGALLAGACALQWHEIDTRRFRGSGLLWMLLAITRPEAPMYAAIGGIGGFVVAANRQGLPWALGWGVAWNMTFLGPFTAWHLWRYQYFAWPFPNTYYAKLAETDKFQPWNWGVRGWNYLRDYAWASAQGWLLPLYALAQSGTRGWRGAVAAGIVAVAALLILPEIAFLQDLPWPDFVDADAWSTARVAVLAAAIVALPALGARRHGAGERALAWVLAATAVFFALYSGGDWMKGHRWLSMAIVPMAVLFTDAFASLYSAVDHRYGDGVVRRVVGRGVLAVPAVASVIGTGVFLNRPETSPYDVHRRVKHMQRVADRLGVERPVAMDVDMGAHMWWSGFDIVDMAGLVDVPMGHHKWQMPFVREYVYGERTPDFAHVHGSWGGKRTNMTRHGDWSRYLEVDPYPVSPYTAHPGNHVRKDLFIRSTWDGSTARSGRFVNGVELVGLDLASTEVHGEFRVTVGWRAGAAHADFRAWLFVHGPGGTVVRELPPGYDWYPPSRWSESEVVVGRHRVALPEDLAAGSYDLGIAIVGVGAGATAIAAELPSPAPRLVAGELRWDGAITVLSREQGVARSEQALAAALPVAAARPCADAEPFARVHDHLPASDPWHADARDRYRDVWIGCLVDRAIRSDDPMPLTLARRLDPHADAVRDAAQPIADRAEAAGNAAADAGDLNTAHRAWLRALAADPTRSALRKRLEETRDRRLGLSADDPAPDPGGAGGD